MKKRHVARIVIPVVIVVILALWGLSYFVVSDILEQRKLHDSLDALSSSVMAGKVYENTTPESLSECVTDGEYADVEKAARGYLAKVYENNVAAAAIIGDSRIGDMLMPSNLRRDAPEFSESKAFITSATAELSDRLEKASQYITAQWQTEYAETAGLDDKKTAIFLSIVKGDTAVNEAYIEQLKAYTEDAIHYLNGAGDVLDFLIRNKGKWSLNTDYIYFDSDELVAEYNELLNEIGL